jgi:hypothetical protein
MAKINLIPPELAVAGSTNKLAQKLTQISIVGAAISIFSALVLLGVFVFFSTQLRKVTTENNSLKNQITNLQRSEQRLVFAKDRLGKIKGLSTQQSALEELEDFDLLYEFVKGKTEITVREVNVDKEMLEVSFYASTLSSITDFFKFLQENKEKLNVVDITSFSFSPSAGYILSLELLQSR